ncbi:MAG TPA: roadblock/LC7 domain-containing protein [Planctomycetota bacterium]|nr:roadblock/LC7 domain-containing protein [Planctomycetota bacterium]
MEGDASGRLGRALIFFKDDVERIERALENYREAARSQCNLLIDLDGHLVTQVGALEGVDVDTVSALVAGTFKATREVARALGEEEFKTLSHQGRDESIQIALVGERTILATVYSPRTTSAGLVSFYLKNVTVSLLAVLERVRERAARPVSDFGFSADVGLAMEGMFGDDT